MRRRKTKNETQSYLKTKVLLWEAGTKLAKQLVKASNLTGVSVQAIANDAVAYAQYMLEKKGGNKV